MRLFALALPTARADGRTTHSTVAVQEATEDKGFEWPAGDVAAPVRAWSTPQECAALFTDTLRAWNVRC